MTLYDSSQFSEYFKMNYVRSKEYYVECATRIAIRWHLCHSVTFRDLFRKAKIKILGQLQTPAQPLTGNEENEM